MYNSQDAITKTDHAERMQSHCLFTAVHVLIKMYCISHIFQNF